MEKNDMKDSYTKVSHLLACVVTVSIFTALAPQARGQLRQTNTFAAIYEAVPDGNASGLSDVKVVSSSIAELSRVRLKLKIAGEFNGDLYGYLRQITPNATNFCILL